MDQESFWPWFAGLMDGEGSFIIAAQIRKPGQYNSSSKYRTIAFWPQIHLKMHEREAPHLDYIRSIVGVGKRYHIKADAKWGKSASETWQTTTIYDTHHVCSRLRPYVRIKQPQVEKVLKACEIIDEARATLGGYNGHIDVILQLISLRDSINPGTYRSRNRKVKLTKEIALEIIAEQHATGGPRARFKRRMLDLSPN